MIKMTIMTTMTVLSLKDPMQRLALGVNGYFSDKNVHFFGVDYSGEREMNRFLDALSKYTTPNFKFTSSSVEMKLERDERFREFRPISNLKSYGGGEVDAYVAIENTASHTGRSAISGPIGILYGMHENEIPGRGSAMIYLITTEEDRLGLSNFAAVPLFEKYVGVKKHMRRIARNTYKDLREKGMLDQISDHPPDTLTVVTPLAPDVDGRIQKLVRKSATLFL